jgi:hypothetical protein
VLKYKDLIHILSTMSQDKELTYPWTRKKPKETVTISILIVLHMFENEEQAKLPLNLLHICWIRCSYGGDHEYCGHLSCNLINPSV